MLVTRSFGPLIKRACVMHLRNHGYTVRPDRDVEGVYRVSDGRHGALLFLRSSSPTMIYDPEPWPPGLKERWGCKLVKWNPPHEANPDLLDSLLRTVEKFFAHKYRVRTAIKGLRDHTKDIG